MVGGLGFYCKNDKKGQKVIKRDVFENFKNHFRKIIINVCAVDPGWASELSLIFKNLFVTCGTIQILRNARRGEGVLGFVTKRYVKIVGGRGISLVCIF